VRGWILPVVLSIVVVDAACADAPLDSTFRFEEPIAVMTATEPPPLVGPLLAADVAPAVPTPYLLGANATPAELANAPCFDCTIEKNFPRAAAEVVLVQLIPWSVNRFMRDAEWAKISPDSWLQNLENPWKWDNNHFVNNQVSHPYHGNLYYNSGRSNGYSFWESSLFAFGGSLTWEYFGEVWAPSPNDQWNTSLGGITIGESLWRLSSLTLDDTAIGFERTLRETGAFLLNPVRGFNRLLDGKMNDVGPNPPDWRPSKWRWSIDAGWRQTDGNVDGVPNQTADQWMAQAKLDYGDSMDDLTKSPFSRIEFLLGLGEKLGDARMLQDFRIRGSLGAKKLDDEGSAIHRLAAFMTYDYYGQPSFEYGAQGFQGGLVSRYGNPDGSRLHTEFVAIAQPVAALKSDYFLSLEGRDYDYGLGFGTKGLARFTHQGFGYVEATGLWLWTPILSGFNGDHIQLSAGVEAKTYPIHGRLGVGGAVQWYERRSYYDTMADVQTNLFQSRLFLTYSAPRWTR